MAAWAIACVCCASSFVSPQSAAPATQATRLELRVDPLMDLESWVRKLGEGKDPLPDVEGLGDAVAYVRELDHELGSPLAWGPIEGALEGSANANDAVKALDDVPESFPLPGGKTIALRERAIGLAQALAKIEPEFREHVWPEHERAVRGTIAELERDLKPKEAQCLAYLMRGLGMEDPHVAIPVVLVAEAPWPGAVTHRRRGGGGICFVGLNAAEGTQFIETILHESTHALDLSTDGQKTVLAELRERLLAAGVGERDRLLRDAPHTLMFVHAAATVRAVLDPAHVAYGEKTDLYSKLATTAKVELPLWTEHLAGRKTREETLTAIVAALVPARAPAAK